MSRSYKDTVNQIRRTKSRVTIITPTYNRADLIEHTMRSVLAQNFDDYTYIIIDDGSTDNTKKVVEDFIKNKKNCFYLYHDNRGEAETVNVGWGLCESEYFVQVNSDDTIEPNLLSEMVKTLDKNPECVVAYPDFYIINQEGAVIEDFKNVEWNFIDALSAFSCYAAAPGAFIRKTAFPNMEKIKDGKYKYINDIKMLWNMALKGDFVYVPKSLASWRSHDEGISIDRYKSIGEVTSWADEYFSQTGLPKTVKDAEGKCRLSIDNYCTGLIENSSTEPVIVGFTKYLNNKNLMLVETTQRLNHENAILKAEKEALKQELESLLQSKSWKVTKPLRQASGVLKRKSS